MKPAANAQANVQNQKTESRPTITLARIVLNGPDTTAFSGWGPKVSGVGNLLRNLNQQRKNSLILRQVEATNGAVYFVNKPFGNDEMVKIKSS